MADAVEVGAQGDRDKFIGFFRLVDACDKPGCPVCRCLQLDARQYLEALLYEQVNDPDTRKRLYASWGFCNWHAWMLRETPDPAFGSSIIYADLLRLAVERLERRGPWPGPGGRLARLRGWLTGARLSPARAALFRRRAPCPACRATTDAEGRYLDATLRLLDDPQLDAAYGRSQGLCVPHVIRALELGGGGPEADRLVERTLPKWTELRRDLSGFVAKHDYRRTEPFTESEAMAWLHAFEILAGAPGVFGNDAHRGRCPADGGS